MSQEEPGTQPRSRRRAAVSWELLTCALRGHALAGTDARELRPQDSLYAREDPDGTRWHRCLRCDSWLALPPPVQPRRPHPPEREQIELPLRGRPLRDRIVLRVIAVDRALHFLALGALGALVLVFSADRATLRHTFYRVLADLQGGVAASGLHSSHGLLHDLEVGFTTSSAHLHLLAAVLFVYAAVEAIEGVGLWYERRWAEYLTFIVTASLLPLEVYEIANRPTVFKVLALLINLAVVGYLLLAKRLFGLRGGGAADRAQRRHDLGWDAVERAGPPAPA